MFYKHTTINIYSETNLGYCRVIYSSWIPNCYSGLKEQRCNIFCVSEDAREKQSLQLNNMCNKWIAQCIL